MVVQVLPELAPVAESFGIPQGSPPHQAGEDRGRPREGAHRRDGGVEAPPPEEAESPGETARRVQTGEGRGQDVNEEP
jgi:hypothetical protein